MATTYTVNMMCNEINEKVNTSGLDFNINLTPYSIHLSICKKFSKLSPVINHSSSTISSNEAAYQQFTQHLLVMKNEYEKLLHAYQVEVVESARIKAELSKEVDLKNELQVKLAVAEEELNSRDLKDVQVNKLRKETKNMQDTCENKSSEAKHLRNEM